jgi:hypothetical protein
LGTKGRGGREELKDRTEVGHFGAVVVVDEEDLSVINVERRSTRSNDAAVRGEDLSASSVGGGDSGCGGGEDKRVSLGAVHSRRKKRRTLVCVGAHDVGRSRDSDVVGGLEVPAAEVERGLAGAGGRDRVNQFCLSTGRFGRLTLS